MNEGWVKLVDEERIFECLCLRTTSIGKNKANLILGLISKGVSYKSTEVIL